MGVSKEALDRRHPHQYLRGMDQWMLAVTSGSVAKGLAKDLEVPGSGLEHCHFSLPPLFHV